MLAWLLFYELHITAARYSYLGPKIEPLQVDLNLNVTFGYNCL